MTNDVEIAEEADPEIEIIVERFFEYKDLLTRLAFEIKNLNLDDCWLPTRLVVGFPKCRFRGQTAAAHDIETALELFVTDKHGISISGSFIYKKHEGGEVFYNFQVDWDSYEDYEATISDHKPMHSLYEVTKRKLARKANRILTKKYSVKEAEIPSYQELIRLMGR